MSNHTLLKINHDHSDRLNSGEFLVALATYLRNPSAGTAEELESFGITVYGLSLELKRGFVNFADKQRYRVKLEVKPPEVPYEAWMGDDHSKHF